MTPYYWDQVAVDIARKLCLEDKLDEEHIPGMAIFLRDVFRSNAQEKQVLRNMFRDERARADRLEAELAQLRAKTAKRTSKKGSAE